jgi:formylglycine-generating enzyme required for sulfatase activity
MAIDYLDFDLEIGRGDGRTYPLAVLHSPAGNVRGYFDLALSQLELANRLLALQNALLRSGGARRKAPTPNEQTVRDFGQELFNSLFNADVRSLFFESKRIAGSQGKFLRVRLRILDPQLAALPWEYLFDARQNEYLCLAHSTPLIRYLEVAQPPQPLTIAPPLRILAMIASPSDTTPLNAAVEKERLERALAALIADGLVELTWLSGQTWRDLHRAMRPNQGPWHVFHFVGHGGFDAQRDEGLLVFADQAGRSDLRTATDVARLLSGQPTLRLALLNACEGAYASQSDIFASTAATLVQQGIPAVIAMQYEITDHAAIEFSAQFYDALTAGLPVDSAVTDARRAVALAINNTLEWGIPVLFMRSPDGVIFAFEEGDGSVTPNAERFREGATRTPDDQTVAGPFPIAVAPPPNQLTGEQLQALWQALLDSYTESTLAQLVRFQLNERLDTIAGGENFADRVYHLIDWAERTGRLPLLIAKAQAGNPGNQGLRQVTLEILSEVVEPPAVVVQTPSPAPNQPTANRTVQPKPAHAPPSSPIAFEWCHVPAGEFLMGSNNHHDDEQPQHRVNLPAFYIVKTPVTNAQYKRFVDAQGHRTPSHWQNGQIPKGKEHHPVVRVGWRDAMAFCQWAGVQLPSEAQWEKAARGTDGRLYPWGNQPPTDKLCNFNNNVKDTTPVNDYPDGTSPYGCLDVAGNVWEWTSSLYKGYPYDPNDGRENLDDGGTRTLRGGAFVFSEFNVRCAARNYYVPDGRYDAFGFRVVSSGAVGR